jgi:hypothetical protein
VFASAVFASAESCCLRTLRMAAEEYVMHHPPTTSFTNNNFERLRNDWSCHVSQEIRRNDCRSLAFVSLCMRIAWSEHLTNQPRLTACRKTQC